MIRRPPRSTPIKSSAASDVYKRQYQRRVRGIFSQTKRMDEDALKERPLPTPPGEKKSHESVRHDGDYVNIEEVSKLTMGGNDTTTSQKVEDSTTKPSSKEIEDLARGSGKHLILTLLVTDTEGNEGEVSLSFRNASEINLARVRSKLKLDPTYVLLRLDKSVDRWMECISDSDIFALRAGDHLQIKMDARDPMRMSVLKREVDTKFTSGKIKAKKECEYSVLFDTPVTREGKTFTAYTVSVTNPNESSKLILKRYSQFNWLHVELKKEFGEKNLPPFPPKKLRNMDPAFVQHRKESLMHYFKEISKNETIRNCTTIKQFFDTSL
eukprot:TRINITY_DN25_c0_g1_i1.p1 TRINITY_DN25_c0_g1~~TRINITY_DN25_c0_g1_i1.p1  ORF type:complete len:325 (+),score=78.80 TRINITY_DN25_c0_g1_i1:2-976(+)